MLSLTSANKKSLSGERQEEEEKVRGRKLPVKCPEGTKKVGRSNIWGEMYKHLCENVVFLALTRQKNHGLESWNGPRIFVKQGTCPPRQNSTSQSTQTSRPIVKNKNPRGKNHEWEIACFQQFSPFRSRLSKQRLSPKKTKLQLSLVVLGRGQGVPISPFGCSFGGFRNWNDREDFSPLFENFP